MTLPQEIIEKIGHNAERYASVQWGQMARFISHPQSIEWDKSKEDYEAGAIEYATKLHQVKLEKDALDVMLDTCGHNYEALQAKYERYEKALKEIQYLDHNSTDALLALDRIGEVANEALSEGEGEKEGNDQLEFSIQKGDLWKHRAQVAEKQLAEAKTPTGAAWVKATMRMPEQTKQPRLYIVKWFDIQMFVRTWTANQLADWVKNTPTLDYFWLDESGTAGDAVKFDSHWLVGQSKDRFEELKHKGWDWRSFYGGWIEGRADAVKDLLKRERQTSGDAVERLQNIQLTDMDAPIFTHTKEFEAHFSYIKGKFIELLKQSK